MVIMNKMMSAASTGFRALSGSTYAKTLLLVLVGVLGYRTFNPVPSRELIITELVVDPRMVVMEQGPLYPAAAEQHVAPAQYVKYTIVCIPIDRQPVCDTAAHTFHFVASPPPALPETRVAGQLTRMPLRRFEGVLDSAGRAEYALDLPAQVSGKDSIEVTAPIFGAVGARDLKLESPTAGNLLDGKMQCQPTQLLSDGGMSQLCVEIPNLKERLAALFDFKIH